MLLSRTLGSSMNAAMWKTVGFEQAYYANVPPHVFRYNISYNDLFAYHLISSCIGRRRVEYST